MSPERGLHPIMLRGEQENSHIIVNDPFNPDLIFAHAAKEVFGMELEFEQVGEFVSKRKTAHVAIFGPAPGENKQLIGLHDALQRTPLHLILQQIYEGQTLLFRYLLNANTHLSPEQRDGLGRLNPDRLSILQQDRKFCKRAFLTAYRRRHEHTDWRGHAVLPLPSSLEDAASEQFAIKLYDSLKELDKETSLSHFELIRLASDVLINLRSLPSTSAENT